MKVVGIVAEYNPFHNGHAYQIEYIRRELKADYIVAVMSGDFVQRGTPALFPKHIRAQMALENGVDLVLELPVRVATASAEGFAYGAVEMLDKLGCVDQICFGSECGEIEPFLQVSRILADEPKEYIVLLQNALKTGKSFPEARCLAFQKYFLLKSDKCLNASNIENSNHFTDESCAVEEIPLNSNIGASKISIYDNYFLNQFLSSPNNILGLEYCKALYKLDSRIEPVTLKRSGHQFHDTELTENALPSASGIRHNIAVTQALSASSNDISASLTDLLSSQVPKSVKKTIVTAVKNNRFLVESDFDLLLHHRLLSSVYQDTLTEYLDVSPSLAQKIHNSINEYKGFIPFSQLLKTREITYTRIQRALLHILLELKKPDINPAINPIPYARVLGFRKSSSVLLREIKKYNKIPLITKLADAEKFLDDSSRQILLTNTYVSNLYEMTLCNKSHSAFRHEYQKSPVIL